MRTSEGKCGIPGPEKLKLNNLTFLFLAANPGQVIQPLGVFLQFTEIINWTSRNGANKKFEGIKVECGLWPRIFRVVKFLWKIFVFCPHAEVSRKPKTHCKTDSHTPIQRDPCTPRVLKTTAVSWGDQLSHTGNKCPQLKEGTTCEGWHHLQKWESWLCFPPAGKLLNLLLCL